LLADLPSPRQPRHDHGGNALSVDSKQPSGGLASFPDVEGVDQVITSPRHVDIRVGSVLRERTPHHVEALVEREPGGAGTPSEDALLLGRWVEAEFER